MAIATVDYQAAINAEKAKGANANQNVIDKLNTMRDQKINDMAMASNGATASTGVGTSTGLQPATSQSDYLNSLYAAQEQSKINALKSAYEANTTDLNASAAKIPDTYNTARNDTAATSAQNQSAFNERAAASGLNNGAGGQASLSMANTLSGNLSSLDKQQAQSVTDIETQRTKLAQQYNTAIQQAMADNDSAKAQALYEEAVRKDNSLVATSQAQASLDQQNQANQTSNANAEYEKKLAKAETQAKYGIFTGYLDLGYSQSDVDAMKAAYNEQQTSSAKSGNGNTKKNNDNAGYTYQGNSESGGYGGATTSDIANSQTRLRAWKSAGYSDADILSSALSDYQSGTISEAEYKSIVAAIQIAAGSSRRNS